MAEGDLANAVKLMSDDALLHLSAAASVTVSREVAGEPAATLNHAVRLKMATACVTDPYRNAVQIRNALATKPEFAAKGASSSALTEAELLTELRAIWTALAQMLYGNAP